MTTPTPTMVHDWIKWTVRPVSVIVDPVTEECLAVELPSVEIGEQVGCASCGEPLTSSSVLTGCIGEEDTSFSL